MSKHTPGPWTCSIARMAADAPVFGFSIRAEGRAPAITRAGTYEHELLIVGEEYRKFHTDHFTEEEVEANGYVLAAAPELLAACQLVAKSALRGSAYDACVAAIAKATAA